jgi:small subunit ribosomal protein S17
MADDKTPEETPEETPEATEAAAEETAPAAEAPAEEATEAPAADAPAEGGADVESEEDRPAGDVNPPPPALTRKEQRTASKHAEASKRKPRTAEERQAERDAERKRKAEQRRRRRVKEREARRAAPKGETPEPVAKSEGSAKVRQGLVVSSKADKTITVRIDTARRHRRYEKIVRSSSTLHAHDPNNDAGEGDRVRVVEARPLSKTKRWRLVEVLERAK